jgi:hypothetical protein
MTSVKAHSSDQACQTTPNAFHSKIMLSHDAYYDLYLYSIFYQVNLGWGSVKVTMKKICFNVQDSPKLPNTDTLW